MVDASIKAQRTGSVHECMLAVRHRAVTKWSQGMALQRELK